MASSTAEKVLVVRHEVSEDAQRHKEDSAAEKQGRSR